MGYAGMHYTARDADMKVQATWFYSPEEATDPEEPPPLSISGTSTIGDHRDVRFLIQGMAPWPTLQLVKFSELEKARGPDPHSRSDEICESNKKLNDLLLSDKVAVAYFRDIRERAKKR